MPVKSVENDAQFQTELESARTKLVVADFFAVWCGPCQRIGPVVEAFSTKYPAAVFLKIDVDKCQETAAGQGVSAMPTFILYRNKVKIDSVRGADPNALEDKIKKYYGGEEEANGDTLVKGHMDLVNMLNKSGSECLNESDEHTLEHGLTSKGGYLESDCDEQLIISLEFQQTVKLHSLKIHGPADKGPRTVKLFINQPASLDFDKAEGMEAVQQLQLKPDDLQEGTLIPLKYVKFQNVANLTIFIKDNQGDEETTQLDYLCIIGSPVNTTNMSDFKRVAGKKGEAH